MLPDARPVFLQQRTRTNQNLGGSCTQNNMPTIATIVFHKDVGRPEDMLCCYQITVL